MRRRMLEVIRLDHSQKPPRRWLARANACQNQPTSSRLLNP